MRTALLALHITGGGAGLVLGPVAMALPKRPGGHPRVGVAYQAVIAVVCVTAVGLAVLSPEVWWLGLIALGTEAAALGGWAVRRRRPPGWLSLHVSLMCGSYVSLVTALLVVNSESPLAWVLPTVVATPLIARTARRAGAGRPARA